MKIQVQYQPKKEEVLVWGLYGERTIKLILERLNNDIKRINKSLKELSYEQNRTLR